MDKYLKEIALKFARTDTAKGREMIYRTDFENLLKDIFKADGKITQINHDSTHDKGNKPDFVISKNSVPVLYIEAKDLGVDLNKIEKGNQMDRYFGYDNLVLTDYVEFRFYRNGQKYGESIKIAEYDSKERKVLPKPENFELLQKTIIDFASSHKEPIKSGNQLARIMGGKAMRIRDNVLDMLGTGKDSYADLDRIQKVVEENLIHGLTVESFADMYAQTLVYGLFAARYNDKTADTFSRSEARDLVPKTNPFLASFFDHIAGTSFPERLRFIVDELCEVFSHADVHKLLTDFYGKEKDNKDPIIHFYEDFLREYDSKKKMDMGVFYTPRPVVDFIVRGVDELLKTEFNITKGLSDTEKILIEKKEIDMRTGKENKINKEYHRVQILDIATGTGTFLNQTIEHIYKGFIGQEGRWQSYVTENLLPRLHGFELMMASYTIAHLKLGMTLHDSGATDIKQRLGVYLTNTLDAPVDYANQNTLFGLIDRIASEAKDASRIKSEYPIMCVIGNPPYAISSSNKGEYITDLISVYKKDLKERNIQPLSDDYIKFIRFAENLIEKNNSGIVAMITNNSFLDGVIHRQMRKHLLETFNAVYIVNLSPRNRENDQNVFDIKQGVSINIFVKNLNQDNRLGNVFYSEIDAKRDEKFNILNNGSIKNINWNKLDYSEPYYFFVPKDFSNNDEYEKGIKLDHFFIENSSGVKTHHDADLVSYNKFETDYNYRYSYRPLDLHFINYDRSLVERDRFNIMKNYINRENIGLVTTRQLSSIKFDHVFLTKNISDMCFVSNKGKESGYNFPLYLYTGQNERVPNLDKEIWQKINKIVGETTPENILDYIYAVLHSPSYREKYKEFLKIDFPRVPYPESKEKFFALASLGEKLRGLHLMTDTTVNDFITTYSVGGDDVVEKLKYENNNVYINSTQYFGNVPKIAWDFYIGGYQPAQKYLKDRKGRKLSNDEIEQYQRIVKVLTETDKLMQEIDKI